MARPQGGHPICLFVTQPANNSYVGKSCTFQMHMARKLKFSFEDTSNVWTPFHNSCNFSINGHRYTSTFSDVTDSSLGMIKANIKNYA